VRVNLAVRRALPVVVAGLALALSACGGSDPEPAAEKAPAAPSASAAAKTSRAGGSSAARPVVAPQPQPAPGDLANFSCSRRHGVWSARGDISSSAQEPMVYTVTVVTVAGADVAGEDTDSFLLEPGESTSFDLPGVSRGAADSCMPRVVCVPR
jgi:hypothetical protein